MALSSRSTRLVSGLTGALAAFAAAPAWAEAPDEQGRLIVHGTVSFGYAKRTTAQDTSLLPKTDAALVGITGQLPPPSTGRNQDDGDLNFNRGDAVAEVFRAYVFMKYAMGDGGVVLSGKAWDDLALTQGKHSYGNSANGYAPEAKLSDAGASPREKFANIVADNFYIYNHNQLDNLGVDWKLGYQKLDWGHRFFVLGGLQDLNPIDVPGLMRPGALTSKDEENRIAIPAAFLRLGQPSNCLEFFYQFQFVRNAIPLDGTFYSQADFMADGNNYVMFGPGNSRQALTPNSPTNPLGGYVVMRDPTRNPSNAGEYGVAYKKTMGATEFGLYAAQFHSRQYALAGFKANNPAAVGFAPFVPNNPFGGNPSYFTENPEKIKMFGATFETRWQGGRVFGEATYRPNQAYAYNATDLLLAFLSNVAPTPLRGAMTAVAPGGEFHAWERHKATQVQAGINQQFPHVLGSKGMTCGAEFIYKGVPDLPNQSVTRFGRSDAFGEGPVNGVNQSASAIANSFDGYVSKSATAYRVFAGLLYENVCSGLNLTPSVFYGKDLSGWSNDLTINQGRSVANVSLKGEVGKAIWAETIWQPTWGGNYNNLRDRGTAQVIVGYKF